MPATNLQNHFLIAMPALHDSFFYRSVVYICEHDEQGAMGLIINRPTKVMLTELLSHLNIDNGSDITHSAPVLFGGPVNKGQGVVLHDHGSDWSSTMQISEATFLTTSTDILEAIGSAQGPAHYLIALGYAGWDAGQLEKELAENSWLTVEANHQLLFETPAEDRWHAAAQLLGFDINLMTNTTGHA